MRTAAVIGAGLIGTSIALALTRHGVAVHLSDTDGDSARTAAAMGAGSPGLPETPVDLAVLAVPPAHIGPELARWQQHGLARAYTDVGSVKARLQLELGVVGVDSASYVGGHPLADGERSGPLAARADLFEGRYWVLTPSARTEQDVLNRALELASLCGAVPVVMDPVDHDRAVALTSHAPHLVAALMAARLAAAGDESVRISGQGLRDVTRIARGDPGLWGDILDANADAVANVVQAYADDLAVAITALRSLASTDEVDCKQGRSDLEGLLQQGNAGHARIPQKGGTPRRDLVVVPVAISDQPGELAQLFAEVSAAGVTVEDIRIEYAPDLPRGLVQLMVARGSAAALTRVLRAADWTSTD